MPLSGKVAIVTGGTRGLGRAIVDGLLKANCHVAFTYRSSVAEAHTIESSWGSQASGYKCDSRSFDETQATVKSIADKLGHMEFLIHNAGVLANAMLSTMQEDEWDVVVDTSLKGAFNSARAVLPMFLKQRYGRIITLASIAGLRGMPGQTNYSTAKAGLLGFTRAAARELGSRNITVNSVVPGFIDVGMTEGISERYRKEFLELVPMRKFGSADDVVACVLFLLSEGAKYITGQMLVVDGGLTA